MKNLPKISDAEWQVMKVLWENSPLRAIDIINRLDNVANWQPKTVKTLIRRLVEKKAISFEENGKYYLYRPIVKEQECIKLENDSFLNRVYGGSLNLMFSNFLKARNLSEEEINDLKKILEKSIDESEE
jgi:BlaI family penicillinase repressor